MCNEKCLTFEVLIGGWNVLSLFGLSEKSQFFVKFRIFLNGCVKNGWEWGGGEGFWDDLVGYGCR